MFDDHFACTIEHLHTVQAMALGCCRLGFVGCCWAQIGGRVAHGLIIIAKSG